MSNCTGTFSVVGAASLGGLRLTSVGCPRLQELAFEALLDRRFWDVSTLLLVEDAFAVEGGDKMKSEAVGFGGRRGGLNLGLAATGGFSGICGLVSAILLLEVVYDIQCYT